MPIKANGTVMPMIRGGFTEVNKLTMIRVMPIDSSSQVSQRFHGLLIEVFRPKQQRSKIFG
jgi:hypothetical protein